jgi:hypothetical protein
MDDNSKHAFIRSAIVDAIQERKKDSHAFHQIPTHLGLALVLINELIDDALDVDTQHKDFCQHSDDVENYGGTK